MNGRNKLTCGDEVIRLSVLAEKNPRELAELASTGGTVSCREGVGFLRRLQCAAITRSSTMKLPFPKDDHTKRMMSPDSPELFYEPRESSRLSNGTDHLSLNGGSVLNGINASPRLMVDKATQMEFNDISDYNGGVGVTFSPVSRDVDSAVQSEWSSAGMNETVPAHSKNDTDDTIRAWQQQQAPVTSSSEPSSNPPQQPSQPADNTARCKLNNNNALPAEDEAAAQTHNTQTLRVGYRSRNSSGSEDEIEKLSDSIIELDRKADEGQQRTTEDGNGEQTRQQGSKSRRADEDAEEEDCAIQCLAYTLQCCECVIS